MEFILSEKSVKSTEVTDFDDVLTGMTLTLEAIYNGYDTQYHRCNAMDSLCEARQFFGWATTYKAKGLTEISNVLLAEGWKAFKTYVSCCDSPACEYCSLQRRAGAAGPI